MKEKDLYNEEQRLDTVLNKLEQSNILRVNKTKINEFKNHLLSSSVGKNKTSRYLYDLIHIAEWLSKPFDKANKKDIERIMMKLEEAKGEQTHKLFSEWTKYGYRIILRKFFKWLRGTRYYPDEVDWIKIKIKECDKKLPEDMLTEEEILSLIDCCNSKRDKALISLIYDSGCRVGELINLRIRDIDYFEKGMKIYLHGKTGTRRIPVIFSAPYLSFWLNEHPIKKPDSYVFVTSNGKRLCYGRVRELIKESAKRAKVDKKVNPHNFRHSRASFYAGKLNDRIMMEFFGWKKTDTIAIYSHLNGKQIDGAILGANGIKTEEDTEKTILKPKKCLRCGKIHEATAIYCTCGYPLDEKVAREIKLNEMQREKADIIMDKIINDPEVWELIKKKSS